MPYMSIKVVFNSIASAILLNYTKGSRCHTNTPPLLNSAKKICIDRKVLLSQLSIMLMSKAMLLNQLFTTFLICKLGCLNTLPYFD
jgi:hypothetical protein